MQAKRVAHAAFSPTARGDTFVFAEDDDELFGGTTPSPFSSRQLKPISDFGPKPQQRPETPREIIKPPPLIDTVSQKIPGMQITLVSQTVLSTEDDSRMTEPPQTDPTAGTTTIPITATTEASDPDAVVCSGRPFDSFMHIKNGSIFAFRGE